MKSLPQHPAPLLACDLDWLFAVLSWRLRRHFGEEPSKTLPAAPALPPQARADRYVNLLHGLRLDPNERLVLLLALAPYVRPALLDALFVRNSTYDRLFTEFGGLAAEGAFVPSLETALFLVAGDDLGDRLRAQQLLHDDARLCRSGVLEISGPEENAAPSRRALRPSPSLLYQLVQGEPWHPRFGASFPARQVETPLEWDDLVLPSETLEQVREIVDWIEFGPQLLGDWGLGKHLKPGYRALFTGPPGTGKTLTATLLGKRTQRPVYRVDLSMVVSKYIGETEKNLEGIFSRAADQDWILFFDEADALFGKRTEVRDAHDRYANQEVSYLLQRVEDYPGVVLLATNFRDNLDVAFLRRFQAIVHFPLPRPREMERLWEQGFSRHTRLAKDVDLRILCQRHQLSGGSIMNVVRHSSLRAAAGRRKEIWLQDIEEGIRREFAKEGKTL